MRNRTKVLFTIYILLAGSLWGTMPLFVRALSAEGFTSIEISTIRSFCAALILGIFLLIKNKSLLSIRLKDSWCFIGTGVISLTFFNICYFTTIQNTSVAIAAILLYTSPVFVVLLSAILFKERLNKLKIAALFIAIFGIALVTGLLGSGSAGQGLSPITFLIGLGSGIGYALYSIFGRYALDRGYSSLTISFYTFLFSAAGLIITTNLFASRWSALNSLSGNIFDIIRKAVGGHTLTIVLLCIGIAVFATILPYLFYTKGLAGVENGTAGIMASIEPVVAAIVGMIAYGEILDATGYLGIALVLTAIVLLNL